MSNRTIAFDIIIFSLFAGVSYLCFVDKTPTIVTSRDPCDQKSKDIYMNIARFLFCLSTVVSVPLRVFPCRIEILLCAKRDKKVSNLVHYGLTLLLVMLSSFVSILVPDVFAAFAVVLSCNTEAVLLEGVTLIESFEFQSSKESKRYANCSLSVYEI